MKIFGHPSIPCPTFTQIQNLEDIHSIPANHIIYFDPSIDQDFYIGQYCQEHQVNYAILTDEIITFFLYANLNAKYCITHNLTLQKLATQYLLDMQILYPICSLEEIPNLAEQNIDGVIFK